MKKWIAIIGALIIAVIVVVVFGLSNLGPIIKKAINNYGPKVTKTEVSVGDVDISLFSVKATLKDFYLGNPRGFSSPEAMKVVSILVDVDKASLGGNPIIIDKLEVISPDITYERMKGTNNFKKIVSNVRKASKASRSSKKTSSEEDPGKRLIIRNFIIRDGKVHLTMADLGVKRIEAALPDIHIKDIGKEKGGASPEEAFKEIFIALYRQIHAPEVTAAFKGGLKEMGIDTTILESKSSKEAQMMVEQLKKLFGRK
jgi:uncharacterized protein involved in outer membrane biogenesis